tara:strand:+ start:16 stop:462 length:447 start_codon:yes stop_codon:yes gene_type:complete
MKEPRNDPLAIALFSEISTIDQLLKSRISKKLPKGMKLSHFAILNHFAILGGEKTPVQLAKSFNVTKGAISNTLNRLSTIGFIHIRPDWDDGRRKLVSISQSGINARNEAVSAIEPLFEDLMKIIGPKEAKLTIPFLRDVRILLSNEK